MTETWYLSRAQLRRDAAIQALAPLLLPADDDARVSAGHRLMWSLFAGDPDGRRDFLWHEEAPRSFLVFSPRPPQNDQGLFDIETRPFAHWPRKGERFAFFLRANPTVSAALPPGPDGRRPRGKREDVVMRLLHPVPGRRTTKEPLRRGEGRAALRDDLLGWLEHKSLDPRRPVHDWLNEQGARHGFRAAALRVEAYRRVQLARDGEGARKEAGRRADALVFGQADLAGELEIADAQAFAAALKTGFGRARAFGCGLMLLARLGVRQGSPP